MICNQPGDKVIFGPQKFTDVPHASSTGPGSKFAGGRLYKLQFQSPPNVGAYAFRAVFVSDTFVGDDLAMDLNVRPPSLAYASRRVLIGDLWVNS